MQVDRDSSVSTSGSTSGWASAFGWSHCTGSTLLNVERLLHDCLCCVSDLVQVCVVSSVQEPCVCLVELEGMSRPAAIADDGVIGDEDKQTQTFELLGSRGFCHDIEAIAGQALSLP